MTAPMDIKEAAKVLRRHNEWRRGADDNHWQQSPYSPAELGHAIDAAVAALEVADRFRPSMDVCGFVGNEFTNKTTGKRWRFDGQSWIEMPPREAFDAAILRRQGERTMSNKDDGGPAFPTDGVPKGDGIFFEGMTLRDYFAAKAMMGLCADPNMPMVNRCAEIAYQVADAMLAERNKP